MVRVSDVYLNGYLRAGGYKSKSVVVETIDGRKTVIFLYEDDGEINDVIQHFRDSQFMRDFVREYLFSKRQITEALKKNE